MGLYLRFEALYTPNLKYLNLKLIFIKLYQFFIKKCKINLFLFVKLKFLLTDGHVYINSICYPQVSGCSESIACFIRYFSIFL